MDIAALKSRLQRIKKREEELVSTKASSSVYTSSSPADAAPHSPPRHVPTTAVATSDAEAFKRTVARAKELATKAQRRNEEREAEESKSSETQTQDR